MDEQLYQNLRAKIDTYSIGFPATKSGVELKILRHFFTPDEADVALHMTMIPEPIAAIASRMGRDPEDLLETLTAMIRKGTVFNSLSPEGAMCFHAAPFMHGFAENSAGSINPELANLLEQYEQDGYLDHFASLPTDAYMRFAPISQALNPDVVVAPYNQIEPMLRSREKIAAIPCYCRDKGKVLGDKCDLPTSNVCFVFDWLADYSVERGQAKYLSLDEALAIQKECETAGLVNMPTNFQTTYVMCHCDGKYCTTFRAMKKLAKPAEAVISDYYMTLEDDCIGCDVCIDACPMEALAGNGSGTVDIDLDRCIGCGVCVPTCVVEALKLQEKPEDRKKRKPIDAMEFVSVMSKHRGFETSPIFASDHQTV